MKNQWEGNIISFVALSAKHRVKMILVGGGAVNFHGYQRHSADVDFWIDTRPENLKKIVLVFQEMGYDIENMPESVINGEQNISIKFSPAELDIDLITRFSVNKTFDEALKASKEVVINHKPLLKYSVLSLPDLITSKIKSGRPKDLLDIQQLQKTNSKP